MYTVRVLSAPHHSLKVMSLEQLLGVGREAEPKFHGQGKGEEPLRAQVQLMGEFADTSFG